MLTETRCNNCGITTYNQPEGDGCHSCLRGIMKSTGFQLDDMLDAETAVDLLETETES